MNTAFRVWQCAIALLGTASYCVYSRSWRDLAHLAYDVPANLTVFGFIGQLAAETISGRWSWSLASRAAMLLGMTVVAAGRDFLHWQVSGHLTCVLAVALVQTADPRLGLSERVVYWIPLPIILALRLMSFDHGQHGQTVWAACLAFLLAAVPIVAARMQAAP